MLVALAVFSLAALALLRLGGATAGNASRIEGQAMAAIVAQGLAVQVQSDPAPPAFGTTNGLIVNGGRRWAWVRTVSRSPEARIQMIDIQVSRADAGPGRAMLTIFRRAG